MYDTHKLFRFPSVFRLSLSLVVVLRPPMEKPRSSIIIYSSLVWIIFQWIVLRFYFIWNTSHWLYFSSSLIFFLLLLSTFLFSYRYYCYSMHNIFPTSTSSFTSLSFHLFRCRMFFIERKKKKKKIDRNTVKTEEHKQIYRLWPYLILCNYYKHTNFNFMWFISLFFLLVRIHTQISSYLSFD